MSTPIRFYFDFNSTFSYIAIHRIDELAVKYGRTVDWRAISLAHLFQAQKITPPPLIPAKLKYLAADFARSCAFEGLPSKIPANFPPDVKLSRLMFWRLKQRNESLSHVFAKAISGAIFGRGEEIVTAEQIVQACSSLAGLTPAEVEAAAKDPGTKQAVITALDQAIADGAIGAPFFVLEDEPFWGADRMDQLERRLAEKKK